MTFGVSVIRPDLARPALGVDAGGSTCRLALIWNGTRHDITAGPANIHSDRAGALATLRTGIADLMRQAGLGPDALAALPAHLGLAGLTGPEPHLAAELGMPLAEITDDQHIALMGAHWGREGVLIGVGTGSFLARLAGGKPRFIGGWGAALGDEASATWIARAALRHALAVCDGLATPTALSLAVTQKIGTRADVIAHGAIPAATLGALAPLVTELADTGCTAAQPVLGEGAHYLERGLQALGWRAPEPVCLTGGLAQTYANLLPGPVRAAITPPNASALDAALMLAQARA